MSSQTALIEAYTAACAAEDVDGIVACVSDDVRWERGGLPAAAGREAFRAVLAADLARGRGAVSVDQVVESRGCAMTVGRGTFLPRDGGPPTAFTRIEAFVFDGGRISLLRSTDSPCRGTSPWVSRAIERRPRRTAAGGGPTLSRSPAVRL